jgi:NAD(P)-dependent dehydrogenase (short-subunit alcohol dehydrogenase family)
LIESATGILPIFTMSHLFNDKVIAITGAASGIGLETAKLLASRGAKVSLADVSEADLEAAVLAIEASHGPGAAISTTLNVRDREAVEKWIADTVSTYGRLDGAANLAGVLPKQALQATLEDVDDEDFENVMGVNVWGTLNCLRAELKVMTEGASVVNAASVGGLKSMRRNGAYVVSKHAVVGLTRAASAEAAERNIRVNAVAP